MAKESRFISDDEDFRPLKSSVQPARQNCHGSCKEIPDRPSRDACPVCGKKNLTLVPVQRTRTGEFGGALIDHQHITAYVIPSHLPKRQK